MTEVAIDNDVLIKAVCYRLLDEITGAFGGNGETAILGAARFVVASRITKTLSSPDREDAQQVFERFLFGAEEIEPTDDELDLATKIEEIAAREAVPLDTGESQLCAVVVSRGISFLLTGDKRAIAGLEAIKEQVTELLGLCGRVVCLEQIVAGLVGSVGLVEVRSRICSAPHVDKALKICFSCANQDARVDSVIDGLRSYVDNLRSSASTMLYARDAFEA